MGQSRGVGAVLTAGVLALTLPAAFIAVLVSRGVPVLPGGSVPASAESLAAEQPPPLAVLNDTPAARSMTAALTTGPGGPWVPISDITWAVGTPYDYACDLAGWKGPRAALSAQRTFTDGSRAATVSLHAFGAGAGAGAFSALRERLNACPQRDASVLTSAATVGSREAVAGSVRPVGFPSAVTTVAWREGDVLAEVHSGTLPPDQLSSTAVSVDDTLRAALSGVCADLDSSADDSVRSPWIDRAKYTGLLLEEPVTAPARPLPSPPAGVVARDLDTPLEPLPTPVTPSATPSDPVWPPLPKPVPTPVVPSPVGPQPTTLTVGTPHRDEVGPGCGWAYTGQAAPTFDETAAGAQRTALLTATASKLEAAQQAWQASVLTYWRQLAAYEAGIGAFRLYAAQLSQVSLAWASLQAARDAYAAALAQWQAAVKQRTDLVTAQQVAAKEYQAQLDACAAIPTGPSPSAPPGPTVPPVPPVPSPTPTLTCPPVRPAVLDLPLPTIPPQPTPPPDPRPSDTKSPAPNASPTPSKSR